MRTACLITLLLLFIITVIFVYGLTTITVYDPFTPERIFFIVTGFIPDIEWVFFEDGSYRILIGGCLGYGCAQ